MFAAMPLVVPVELERIAPPCWRRVCVCVPMRVEREYAIR